jgi:hypothetical protein
VVSGRGQRRAAGSRSAVRAAARRLGDGPGVYRSRAADGTVLYLGRAVDLRRRVLSYFADLRDRGHLAPMVHGRDPTGVARSRRRGRPRAASLPVPPARRAALPSSSAIAPGWAPEARADPGAIAGRARCARRACRRAAARCARRTRRAAPPGPAPAVRAAPAPRPTRAPAPPLPRFAPGSAPKARADPGAIAAPRAPTPSWPRDLDAGRPRPRVIGTKVPGPCADRLRSWRRARPRLGA